MPTHSTLTVQHLGKHYATRQGGEALMTTTLDGNIKARLAGKGGDIREPAWGPYQKY